jgi:hypothetical protein
MSAIPGWYIDAIEQQMGQFVNLTARIDTPVEVLAAQLSNRFDENGEEMLTVQEHVDTLALSVAILIRRLARVDTPT